VLITASADGEIGNVSVGTTSSDGRKVRNIVTGRTIDMKSIAASLHVLRDVPFVIDF